jgi:hypothetical protein
VTAVLAAAARAILAAVALLACVTSPLWVAYGPPGAWVMVRLAVMVAVVTAAVLGWSALWPRRGGGGDDPR